MGRKSRDKGYRAEREMVQLHRNLGVAAVRVPLSGAVGDEFGGDMKIPVCLCRDTRHKASLNMADAVLVSEIKARKNGAGFKTLEGWLGDADVLFLRRDRAEPLVVLPWQTWARLIG